MRFDDQIRYAYGRDIGGNPIVTVSYKLIEGSDGNVWAIAGAAYCRSCPSKVMGRKIADGRLETQIRGEGVGRDLVVLIGNADSGITLREVSSIVLNTAVFNRRTPTWVLKDISLHGEMFETRD